MMTTFSAEEIPKELLVELPRDQEIRCPHFNEKRGRVCNRLLCIGRASIEPQEFKCPNCGMKTKFKRVDR